MIDDSKYTPQSVSTEEWSHAKCDKYDYMIAAFCGAAAGLVDVFFVGDPLTSRLGKSVNNVADGLVKKAARFFWDHDKRVNAKGKRAIFKDPPQTLSQCISYLEQSFPVPYDARYAKDLVVEEGVLSGMRPANHHLLSLSHSPDPIGLIFSIIDQFTGCGTYVDKGHLIRAIPRKTSNAIPYMQGSDLPSMLFCGFVNWIGHLLSDMAGASSTRQPGKTGQGAGIPIPFYELFLFCDFGGEDGNTLADTMIKVYEEGYDLRFGVTMAIPVLMEELMIKAIWTIRQKFIRKKSWRESFPSSKHADLRIMLLVGNATLCAIDGVDAAARGIATGNVVTFICHLNLVGWARLVMLVLKELLIRVGPVVNQALERFMEAVGDILTPAERARIDAFKQRLAEYDQHLLVLFNEFVAQVEKEYQELYGTIHDTFDESRPAALRAESSVKLAELSGVKESKIIRNLDDLDNYFSS